MTESNGTGPGGDRLEATPSATITAPRPQSSDTHALAERLTAMMHYFAAARGNLDKGNIEAAKQLFVRFLEQSDRAREIAERIRISMNNRLP